MPSTDGSSMAEQFLDHPAEVKPPMREMGGGATPSVAPVSVSAAMPVWRWLADAVIRADGEEGPVDLVALHPARGVALMAFLDDGQEASPDEAREALRTMLRDEGLPRRFPGELPIVALPVPRTARKQIAVTVEQAFAGLAAPTLSDGWVDWIAERLTAERTRPAVAAPRLVAPVRDEPQPEKVVSALLLTVATEPSTAPAPRLHAPQRDEAVPAEPANGIALTASKADETMIAKASPDSEVDAPSEMPPLSEVAAQPTWLDWGATLGFALGLGAALIAGVAAVLRNGRLF
jgi:hypothetical protein